MSTSDDRENASASESRRVVEREIEIEAPVSTVWEALTSAEELERWFPLEAKTTPGVGGSMYLKWGEAYAGDSEIEAWEPNKHLRTRFPVGEGPRLCTDYYLDGQGGKTVLRVVTSGFEGGAWSEHFDGVKAGWTFELQSLRHYLERHFGKRRNVAWARKSYKGSHQDAWSRLMALVGLSPTPDLGVGAPYVAKTRTGEDLNGGVLVWGPPRQFVGTVDAWNTALLRVETKGSEKAGSAQVWLSTYGVKEDQVQALEQRWQETLEALFAT